MSYSIRYLFTVTAMLLIVSLSGCSLLNAPNAPTDGNGTHACPNVELIGADRVLIDRVSVNGVVPPASSWDRTVAKLRDYVRGELVINELVSVSLAVDDNGYPVEAQSIPIEEVGLHQITLVFVPKSKKLNRGLYKLHSNNQQIIVYNKDKIEKSAVLFLSKKAVWETVLLHEIGHALRVPADVSHTWKGGHCTDPRCVMYPTADFRSGLTGLVSGLPKDFCPKCRSEIFTAKESDKSVQESPTDQW